MQSYLSKETKQWQGPGLSCHYAKHLTVHLHLGTMNVTPDLFAGTSIFLIYSSKLRLWSCLSCQSSGLELNHQNVVVQRLPVIINFLIELDHFFSNSTKISETTLDKRLFTARLIQKVKNKQQMCLNVSVCNLPVTFYRCKSI